MKRFIFFIGAISLLGVGLFFQNCSPRGFEVKDLEDPSLVRINEDFALGTDLSTFATPLCEMPEDNLKFKLSKTLFETGLCADMADYSEPLRGQTLGASVTLCGGGPSIQVFAKPNQNPISCRDLTVCGQKPTAVEAPTDSNYVILNFKRVYGCIARVAYKKSENENFKSWEHDFGVYACQDCNSAPGKKICPAASCIDPIPGLCNEGNFGCRSGTLKDDNNLTGCGQIREWTCEGLNGGESKPCHLAGLICETELDGLCSSTTPGKCGHVAAPDTDGSNDNGKIGPGDTRTWTCAGRDGGATVNCAWDYGRCNLAPNVAAITFENSKVCDGDDQSLPKGGEIQSLVATCSDSKKCEYTCSTGFTLKEDITSNVSNSNKVCVENSIEFTNQQSGPKNSFNIAITAKTGKYEGKTGVYFLMFRLQQTWYLYNLSTETFLSIGNNLGTAATMSSEFKTAISSLESKVHSLKATELTFELKNIDLTAFGAYGGTIGFVGFGIGGTASEAWDEMLSAVNDTINQVPKRDGRYTSLGALVLGDYKFSSTNNVADLDSVTIDASFVVASIDYYREGNYFLFGYPTGKSSLEDLYIFSRASSSSTQANWVKYKDGIKPEWGLRADQKGPNNHGLENFSHKVMENFKLKDFLQQAQISYFDLHIGYGMGATVGQAMDEMLSKKRSQKLQTITDMPPRLVKNPTCTGGGATTSTEIGTLCFGGAIWAGTYDGGNYMIMPSGCSDIPAGGTDSSSYSLNDFTPACNNGRTDTLRKTWNDGRTNYYDIPGVESFVTSQKSSSLYRGDVNQSAIVAITASGEGGYHAAARYCDKLDYGGFTDWYLPSKSELAYIFCKAAKTLPSSSTAYPQEDPNCGSYGGRTSQLTGFVEDHYWSSTEYPNTAAWTQDFRNGSQGGTYKDTSSHMRCVCRFLGSLVLDDINFPSKFSSNNNVADPNKVTIDASFAVASTDYYREGNYFLFGYPTGKSSLDDLYIFARASSSPTQPNWVKYKDGIKPEWGLRADQKGPNNQGLENFSHKVMENFKLKDFLQQVQISSFDLHIGYGMGPTVGQAMDEMLSKKRSQKVQTITVTLANLPTPDPCLGTTPPQIGSVCSGGAIWAGNFDGGNYMIMPSGCSDIPADKIAGGSRFSSYALSEFTPTCDNRSDDNILKTWNDGTKNFYDIPGVETIQLSSQMSSSSYRGNINQAAIVAITDAGQGGYHAAARYCDKLSFGGYNDWYLPSKSELAYIYCKATLKGASNSSNPEEGLDCAKYGGKTSQLGGFVSFPYWSSTEANMYTVYNLRFDSDNGTSSSNKENIGSIRCVRRF